MRISKKKYSLIRLYGNYMPFSKNGLIEQGEQQTSYPLICLFLDI